MYLSLQFKHRGSNSFRYSNRKIALFAFLVYIATVTISPCSDLVTNREERRAILNQIGSGLSEGRDTQTLSLLREKLGTLDREEYTILGNSLKQAFPEISAYRPGGYATELAKINWDKKARLRSNTETFLRRLSFSDLRSIYLTGSIKEYFNDLNIQFLTFTFAKYWNSPNQRYNADAWIKDAFQPFNKILLDVPDALRSQDPLLRQAALEVVWDYTSNKEAFHVLQQQIKTNAVTSTVTLQPLHGFSVPIVKLTKYPEQMVAAITDMPFEIKEQVIAHWQNKYAGSHFLSDRLQKAFRASPDNGIQLALWKNTPPKNRWDLRSTILSIFNSSDLTLIHLVADPKFLKDASVTVSDQKILTALVKQLTSPEAETAAIAKKALSFLFEEATQVGTIQNSPKLLSPLLQILEQPKRANRGAPLSLGSPYRQSAESVHHITQLDTDVVEIIHGVTSALPEHSSLKESLGAVVAAANQSDTNREAAITQALQNFSDSCGLGAILQRTLDRLLRAKY